MEKTNSAPKETEIINLSTSNFQDHSESDTVTCTNLLQRDRRMLYFSDGTMEDSCESEKDADADVPDKSVNASINENEIAFVPHLKSKVYKVGSSILAGIDYIGGGIASVLGITTPKYASEIECYKRSIANPEVDVEENGHGTWCHIESGNALNRVTPNEIVTKDPTRDGWTQGIN